MEKGMEARIAWATKYNDQLMDLGNPLMYEERLIPCSKGEKSTWAVCGYSILQADDLEQAK
jgi:hypothetical protein